MPKQFVTGISGPSSPTASRPDTQSAEDSANATLGAIEAIGEGFAKLGEMQDNRLLSQAQRDLDEASGSTKGYFNQMEDLETAMVSASAQGDTAQMAELAKTMRALRQGELRGALSPMAANIKLQQIAKVYATRYPHLQKQIGALYQQSFSNMPEAPEVDTFTQAGRELLKAATKEGLTIQAYLKENEFIEEGKRAEVRAKLNAEKGGQVLSPLQSLFQNSASAAEYQLLKQLRGQMARGTLSKETAQSTVRGAIQQLTQFMNDQMAEAEQIAHRAGHTTFFLDAKDKDEVMENALSNLKDLSRDVEGWDSVDKGRRWVEFQMARRNNKYAEDMENLVGKELAPLYARSQNPEALLRSFGQMARLARDLKKGTLRDAIAQAAGEGSDEMRGLYMLIKNIPENKLSIPLLNFINAAGVAAERGDPAPMEPKPTGNFWEGILGARAASNAVKGIIAGQVTNPAGEAGIQAGYISMIQRAPMSVIKDMQHAAYLARPESAKMRQTLVTKLDEFLNARAGRLSIQDLQKIDPKTLDVSLNSVTKDQPSFIPPDYVPPAQVGEELVLYRDALQARKALVSMGGATPDAAAAESSQFLQSHIQDKVQENTESLSKPGMFDSPETMEKSKPAIMNMLKNWAQNPELSREMATLLMNEIQNPEDPKLETLGEGVYQDTRTGEIVTINKDPKTKKYSVSVTKKSE